MHKKRNNLINLYYDIHIVEALQKLPAPLITFDGHQVLFDEDKRKETIFEHIANKKHHLHVVDIKRIPYILKDKESLSVDHKEKNLRIYIGKRGKQTEKPCYLKIITHIKKNNNESVITIYPDKKLL